MIKRIFKYGLVGISGAVIGLGIITICVEILKISPRHAWYISTFLAVLSNFLLNNYYTWSDRKAREAKEFSQKIGLYFLFTSISLVLNYLIYNFLLNKGLHYLIALVIAIAICAVINFSLNGLIVWRKRPADS